MCDIAKNCSAHKPECDNFNGRPVPQICFKEKKQSYQTPEAVVGLNNLLSAFKEYTAKNGRPYIKMTLMDDGSGEMRDGENVIAGFDDITGLSKLLGT